MGHKFLKTGKLLFKYFLYIDIGYSACKICSVSLIFHLIADLMMNCMFKSNGPLKLTAKN